MECILFELMNYGVHSFRRERIFGHKNFIIFRTVEEWVDPLHEERYIPLTHPLRCHIDKGPRDHIGLPTACVLAMSGYDVIYIYNVYRGSSGGWGLLTPTIDISSADIETVPVVGGDFFDNFIPIFNVKYINLFLQQLILGLS